MSRLTDTLTGGAQGCPRGNCNQGRTCDCDSYPDEVLLSQAPSPDRPCPTDWLAAARDGLQWPRWALVAALCLYALACTALALVVCIAWLVKPS